MYKIDFFGGLHGNYLEFIVNTFVCQIPYDFTKPIFNENGACHLKNKNINYMKNKLVTANHYSSNKILFSDDLVIRIVPSEDDLLIGVTNSFLRAGDQVIELNHLEKNTIDKLTNLSKGYSFLQDIINQYGKHVDYPRQAIRNFFYSKFSEPQYGLTQFNQFDSTVTTYYNFPFSAFFNINNFYAELNKIGFFLNFNFYPTVDLLKVHTQFLELNQGYHSNLKCQNILTDIIHGNQTKISLNILEEGWLNWQIAKIFRCYDLPILIDDVYPKNTLTIFNELQEWKSKNH